MGERATGGRPAGRAGADTGTRWTATWLGAGRPAGEVSEYPGERLGLPRTGSGAAASYGRRLLALFLDWTLSWLVGALVLSIAGADQPQLRSLANLVVFGVETWLLTAMIGVSAGKLLCGLRVLRIGGGPVGFGWSLVRALLVLAVVPALLWDRDHRGVHDRAADTVVVRA